MNVYIGYKYRNNDNKEALKEILTKISDSMSSLGHKTFILDRDNYNWEFQRTSTTKSVAPILKNMVKSDIFLAFIDCNRKSTGLILENICAKVLGKKTLVAIQKGIKDIPLTKFANETIEFDNHDDLINKIQSSLKSLS
jgi:hypothetical protein